MSGLSIVPAAEEDFPSIWRIFDAVVKAGETYAYGEEVDEAWTREYWMRGPGVCTFIAKENGTVLGVCVIRPAWTGRASHIANASYAVAEEARGRGIGRQLGQFAVAEARRQGYKAMLYRFVVSTNEAAVNLWKSLGFTVIGVIPQGYQHRHLGLVDVFIMHRNL